MSGFLCSMVGASFTVAAAAEVIRKKTSILAAGSTTSTTQSKFGGSSATFNGSSQYINVPNQTQLDISAYSNWTIECWARLTDGTSRTILNKDGIAGSLYPGYTFYTNGSKQVTFGVGGSAGNWVTVTRSTALADNTWYHLAGVKNGSTITFYVDGVSAGTATFVGYTDQSRSLYIGWEADGTYMYGYIDEVRISKIARYTTTFTSSTTALVNDADTVLLMHMDGTNASTFFEDDNGVRASNGISALGNAQIDTAQSKFGGASLLLDGTGDYLQVSPAGVGLTNSDNFTIEGWVRLVTVPPANNNWQMFIAGSATGGNTTYMAIKNSAGTITSDIVLADGAGNFIEQEKTIPSISANTWYHWAITKSGSTLKHYWNGTELTTTYASIGTMTSSYGMPTLAFVGRWSGDSAWMWNGHLDEIRVSSSVRYTANFTPSTTPFVNDVNTLLLIHADGTDATTVFTDDNGIGRSQNNGRRNSSAVISTTRSKFGGSSIYLPSDYVTFANEIIFPDNQDFTWEFWVNEDVVQNCKYIGGQTAGDIFIGHDNYGVDTYSNRLAVGVVAVGWYMDFGVTLAADTWYHVCVQRSGDTVYGYTDGTLRVTHTGYLANYSWSWRNLQLSGERDGLTVMNGYQDEIRFSNIVRYATAGFTAPTAPFQNDANTVLLIHGDGSNNSTVFIDDNGTRPV